MRALWAVPILGAIVLGGCLPNPVSVSRDGTIALTLSEQGEYELIQDGGRQVYLTNANAEFLTPVEGMDDCRFPVISPSGRFIVACSEKSLVLCDRKTSKLQVIYRAPGRDADAPMGFPVWSDDERRIAFFGPTSGEEELYTLNLYDVRRRELEVLDRRAAPQATWLPNSRGLLYTSFPSGDSKRRHLLGDLRMIDVRTGRQKVLSEGDLLPFSKTAAFPEGTAILFAAVNWDGAEIGREGLTAPLVLRKQIITPFGGKATAGSAPSPEQDTSSEPKGEPSLETAGPATSPEGQKPFVLEEGQPFYCCSFGVSPDGQRIAYVRLIWEDPAVADNSGDVPRSKKDNEPTGTEACVAGADGNGSVVVARNMEDDGFGQVIWLTNTRLLCVGGNRIVAVDADGKNTQDLTETIRAKFFKQVGREVKDQAPTSDPPNGER